MTCCPLGSLLIKAWMTWNSGLGSEAAASSALQNNTNKVTSRLTRLKKKAVFCYVILRFPDAFDAEFLLRLLLRIAPQAIHHQRAQDHG